MRHRDVPLVLLRGTAPVEPLPPPLPLWSSVLVYAANPSHRQAASRLLGGCVVTYTRRRTCDLLEEKKFDVVFIVVPDDNDVAAREAFAIADHALCCAAQRICLVYANSYHAICYVRRRRRQRAHSLLLVRTQRNTRPMCVTRYKSIAFTTVPDWPALVEHVMVSLPVRPA